MKKKIILGTSDAWSMSRSSQRPSDPAYYIEDCRISILCVIAEVDNFSNDFAVETFADMTKNQNTAVATAILSEIFIAASFYANYSRGIH